MSSINGCAKSVYLLNPYNNLIQRKEKDALFRKQQSHNCAVISIFWYQEDIPIQTRLAGSQRSRNSSQAAQKVKLNDKAQEHYPRRPRWSKYRDRGSTDALVHGVAMVGRS